MSAEMTLAGVVGLIHLLTIAIRLLTLIAFIMRQALKREQAHLAALHKENPKKATATPTDVKQFTPARWATSPGAIRFPH